MREYNGEFERVMAESIPSLRASSVLKRSPSSRENLCKMLDILLSTRSCRLAQYHKSDVLTKLVDIPVDMTDKVKGIKLTAVEKNRINTYMAQEGLRDALDYLSMRIQYSRIPMNVGRTKKHPLPEMAPNGWV